MNRKKYLTPEMEINLLEDQDVIYTSGLGTGNGNFEDGGNVDV